jgi:hypothetical protein
MNNMKYVAIAIILAWAFIAPVLIFQQCEKANTWRENYQNAKGIYSELKEQIMTEKDFRELYPKLAAEVKDSIPKYANVKEVTENNYTIVYDTVKTIINTSEIDTVYIDSTKYNLYPFNLDTACLTLTGYAVGRDVQAIDLTSFQLSDTLTTVQYEKRDRWLPWLFGGLPWGKKRTYIKQYGRCGKQETKTNIKIE